MCYDTFNNLENTRNDFNRGDCPSDLYLLALFEFDFMYISLYWVTVCVYKLGTCCEYAEPWNPCLRGFLVIPEHVQNGKKCELPDKHVPVHDGTKQPLTFFLVSILKLQTGVCFKVCSVPYCDFVFFLLFHFWAFCYLSWPPRIILKCSLSIPKYKGAVIGLCRK